MHLLKFMNWVLTHNVTTENGTYNPCSDFKTEFEFGIGRFNSCPGCDMKQLVQTYWGKDNSTDTDDVMPATLSTYCPPMINLQQIGNTWLPLSQQGNADEFYLRILKAVRSSVTNTKWHDQYDGLFVLDVRQRFRCQCNEIYQPDRMIKRDGYDAISVKKTGHDDI